jgi:signal transduction histidine kinase
VITGLTPRTQLTELVESSARDERLAAQLELAWRLRLREPERSRGMVEAVRSEVAAAGRVALFDLRRSPPPDADAVRAMARRDDLDALWSLRAMVVGADRLIDRLAAHDASALADEVRTAVERADGLCGPGDLQAVENMLGRVCALFPARKHQAVVHYERAAELAELAGEHTATAICLVNAGGTRHELGDPSGALSTYLRALEVAEHHDAPPRVLSFVHGNIAILYRELGASEEATRHVSRAVSVGRRCDSTHLLRHALAVQARVALATERHELALQSIDELTALSHGTDDGLLHVADTLRALCRLVAGHPREALADLDAAPVVTHPDGVMERTWVRARALTRLGHTRQAVDCLEPVIDDLLGATDPVLDGVFEEHVGNLRSLGRHDDAIDLLLRRTAQLQAEPRRSARLRLESLARDVELRSARASADDASAQAERLQTQLRRAQRMESFGQLAAGLAHDFNNALTIVLTAADQLEFAESPLEHAQTLEVLRKAVDQAATLTRRLFAIARKSDLSLQRIELASHLRELMPVLQAAADGRRVRLDVSGHPTVEADPGALDQVLLNLVINARDATGPAGLITLEARDTAHRVQLSVADDGAGIAPADLHRIFDPFFSTKGSKGTGLGLAMVWGIAQQLGGDVSVDSEPGRGTRFTLDLPASHRA